jgi:hypothetical protein
VESLSILVFLALLLAAAAPALYLLTKRMANGERRLELWRVLARRGLSPTDATGEPRSLAFALRRCALCPSVDACNRWLAREEPKPLEDFCPNAEYFRKLERG